MQGNTAFRVFILDSLGEFLERARQTLSDTSAMCAEHGKQQGLDWAHWTFGDVKEAQHLTNGDPTAVESDERRETEMGQPSGVQYRTVTAPVAERLRGGPAQAQQSPQRAEGQGGTESKQTRRAEDEMVVSCLEAQGSRRGEQGERLERGAGVERRLVCRWRACEAGGDAVVTPRGSHASTRHRARLKRTDGLGAAGGSRGRERQRGGEGSTDAWCGLQSAWPPVGQSPDSARALALPAASV